MSFDLTAAAAAGAAAAAPGSAAASAAPIASCISSTLDVLADISERSRRKGCVDAVPGSLQAGEMG